MAVAGGLPAAQLCFSRHARRSLRPQGLPKLLPLHYSGNINAVEFLSMSMSCCPAPSRACRWSIFSCTSSRSSLLLAGFLFSQSSS